jgi:CO/xanthine dehydrogenase Mo-binding subunit
VADETLNRILGMMDNARADAYPLERERAVRQRGVRRVDGYEKASGQAVYTFDVALPGMLHMRWLTSPYAHCRIKSLDTSRAEAFEGVRAILRYDDPELPDRVDLGGHVVTAEPPIPSIAYFEGQEIGAVVAADSVAVAEQAVRLIDVEWEEQPFLLDVLEAMKPDAPLTKPENFPVGNIRTEQLTGRGDVEKGFAEADSIIEFTYRQHLNTWVGPERPCGVFRWNGEAPEIWVKHQRPHIVKRCVAKAFAVPMSRISLHCPRQGASFGGWNATPRSFFGMYCAGLISRRTGRPVKWTMNRRNDFCGGNMDEGVVTLKVGTLRDGTITAVSGDTILANQEYPIFGNLHHTLENTRIPHVREHNLMVEVNAVPTVPVRCEQNTNVCTLNLMCNKVAGELGLDPIEVALKNDGAEGHDIAWLSEKKLELGFAQRDSLRECVEKGKAAMDWDAKWHVPGTKSMGGNRMHGLGFVWTHEWEDSGGSSEIAIRLERNDGSATIYGCRADGGQNAETAYCQIAADELGLPYEKVFYRQQEDTGFFAMTPDTSTNLTVNGFAVRNAARILKRRILEAAVAPRGATQLATFPPIFPGLQPEDLDIEEGFIFEKTDPANRVSMAEFVMQSAPAGPMTETEFPIVGVPMQEFTAPLFADSYQVQQGCYAERRLKMCRQAHFLEGAVDTETGKIDVLKVVTVNDVGHVINWDGCEGQQYGGTYMAMGRGLYEEMVTDPVTGVYLNADMLNYKIPTILDVGPIETRLLETGMGYGPYGAVGIGEDVATCAPYLIPAAVFNATGVWVDEYPVTPARVLRALGKV